MSDDSAEDLRAKLRSEIQAVDGAALVPHYRRGALLVIEPRTDILEVAVAIARDDTGAVAQLLDSGRMARPSAAQLADWCVEPRQRFQFVILQPYVLAQPLPVERGSPC